MDTPVHTSVKPLINIIFCLILIDPVSVLWVIYHLVTHEAFLSGYAVVSVSEALREDFWKQLEATR